MSGECHKRVLLLGPTGVNKAEAGARLKARAKDTFSHEVRYVDFENEFLKGSLLTKDWMTFLAQDVPLQAHTWQQAWQEFEKTIDSQITILGIHATFVSGALGLRCPINIPKICEQFRPTLIVTLIDDVFSMWSRTEGRADGMDRKGRPSFEQLLVARRAEQFMGDILRSHSRDPKTRHLVCAAGNDLNALLNLIIFDAKVTYLSFPISVPRKLALNGDMSFVDIINEAHMLAAKRMVEDRSRAFISPLAIDELPLVSKAKNASDGATPTFNCSNDRWPIDNLWGTENSILPSPKTELKLPLEQVQFAGGVISTDVGWRDRRLVLQSDSLAVLCPKPPNEDRITRGVKEEIEMAVPLGIVCHYWQKPEWDAGDYVRSQFNDAGSMGIGQTQALVLRLSTLNDLIRATP